MKRIAIACVLLLGALAAPAGAEVRTIRMGWCAKTVSSAAAPFAIAQKLGWFEKAGIKVELVPLPGSTDCVKLVATRDVQVSLPSMEPLAIIRPQGVKAKFFYTAYQGNIYGIAVPADSPVKTMADLKGKRIGVTSMASAGVVLARALAKQAGLDPDKDISIVVAGEAAQTAALLRSKQIDALSQFDTQYALTENAGTKLRLLDTSAIARFPSNGFVTLEETLPLLRPGGVYVCEDVQRLASPLTFFAMGLVDDLNRFAREGDEVQPSPWQQAVYSIHFYPYVLVIERRHEAPFLPVELLSNREEGPNPLGCVGIRHRCDDSRVTVGPWRTRSVTRFT